ncbi:hypothetical protein BZA70DRAFT_281796 [Myxozyma melibiosi]|uniref:SHSP domain-containing protein n=1 Tax=Myxozyma melibiosi TaxID=54550 RepID=A0ABR1F2Y5_9ASCO
MPDIYTYPHPWAVLDSLTSDLSSRSHLRLQYAQRKAALAALDTGARPTPASAPASPSSPSDQPLPSVEQLLKTHTAPPGVSVDSSSHPHTFNPLVDVYDFPNCYLVQASIPGVQVSDILVDFDNRSSILTIAGAVHRSAISPSFNLCSPLATRARLVSQREVGRFERSIRLIKDVRVAANDARAKCKDGVLEIIVPKIPDDSLPSPSLGPDDLDAEFCDAETEEATGAEA